MDESDIDTTTATTPAHAGGATSAPPGPTRWARTASFGFLLMLVAPLFAVALSIFDQFNAFALIFSAVTAGVALLGRWLVLSGRRWRIVVAVVLAGLGLLANGSQVATLRFVESFWDFAPILVFLTGAVVAVVAGIATLATLSRGEPSPAAAERRIRLTVLAGVGGVLAVSAVVTLTGGDTVDPELRAGATEVRADDFAFSPEVLEANPGDRFIVINDDLSYHTFTIDELGIDVVLLPGDEALVEVPGDAAGTFEFLCTPHVFDDEGMRGTLTVSG